MPQRAQRIGSRRAPRWDEGRDDHDAQDEPQGTRERDGVGRTDAKERATEQPADAECRDNADRRADPAEPQPAGQKPATTESRGAPSAMRMPISCVLCLTIYDTSP